MYKILEESAMLLLLVLEVLDARRVVLINNIIDSQLQIIKYCVVEDVIIMIIRIRSLV